MAHSEADVHNRAERGLTIALRIIVLVLQRHIQRAVDCELANDGESH